MPALNKNNQTILSMKKETYSAPMLEQFSFSDEEELMKSSAIIDGSDINLEVSDEETDEDAD